MELRAPAPTSEKARSGKTCNSWSGWPGRRTSRKSAPAAPQCRGSRPHAAAARAKLCAPPRHGAAAPTRDACTTGPRSTGSRSTAAATVRSRPRSTGPSAPPPAPQPTGRAPHRCCRRPGTATAPDRVGRPTPCAPRARTRGETPRSRRPVAPRRPAGSDKCGPATAPAVRPGRTACRRATPAVSGADRHTGPPAAAVSRRSSGTPA